MRGLMLGVVMLLGGCASGTINYSPPASDYKAQNSIEIAKPREEVWKGAVPAIGREFFVINNLDQSSGLMNLSYTGDPEKYIDCGIVSTTVTNVKGTFVYNFAGAAAQTYYETFTNMTWAQINRRVSLEGRVNIIFEALSPERTRVTANTRYVVQREQNIRAQGMQGQGVGTVRHSISFGSNQSASFPMNTAAGSAVECRANGKLETDLLRLISGGT
jgi:hypothetical protein